MKIYQLKTYVYQITKTTNTKQLKKLKPELVQGKDLRKKASWLSIYNALKLVYDFQYEQVSKNLEDQYDFQEINLNSSITELIKNIQSIGKLNDDLDYQLNQLEQKYRP